VSRDADGADHRTIERLALAEWSVGAAARVVSTRIVGLRAEVMLSVNGDYEYWAYFQRDADGHWRETVSGTGPCADWEDPSAILWGP
jgi:hypothetical protein